MSDSGKVLVAGLGSPHGDDQAGWFVAEQLLKKMSVLKKMSGTLEDSSRHHVQHVVVRRAMIPLDVLDWMDDVDVLHICDACEPVPGRGTLHRYTWESGRLVDARVTGTPEVGTSEVHVTLNSLRGGGSHDFSVRDMLRLAAETHLLPEQVIIWAIEGTSFQPEDQLSDQTRKTAWQAVNEMMQEFGASDA